MAKAENNYVSGTFECNICLDTVQDPVVTLCGHLYCWPCIYKWIQYQETTPENAKCPICKTEISEKDIVPLYGPSLITQKRGPSESDQAVPPRPSTPRSYRRLAPSPLALPGRDDITMDSVVVPSPTIGMLGEMVSGRILRDLESPLFGTPNSYNLVMVTRRERLHTTHADRSLSQMCSFFICCVIFCFLMFT
ncbi:E3 ubiquitin-protein ligase RMA1H1-like [Bidens hawaiensis]|uniref:E3 ubiquitin-protein ligase RMA1H1-like n=1 Tax=Bidens hawaiensis TaxID=980011 RepID=UPI00404A43B6